MSLDTDLYAQLVTYGYPVEQNKIDVETTSTPRVWFQRQNANTELLLNGGTFSVTTMYTVEVAGLDVDAVNTAADAIKNGLNGFSGTMGGSKVLGIFVEDASDDYVPKMLSADEGFHVNAFHLEVFT